MTISNENNAAVMDLPHMAEVFEALRRGKHVSFKDGDIFNALKKHEGVYEQLFSKLGFKLIRHARDFIYFLDTSNFKKDRPGELMLALRYERALAYEGLGQAKRARSDLETIFAADPDFADVAGRLETPTGSGKQNS